MADWVKIHERRQNPHPNPKTKPSLPPRTSVTETSWPMLATSTTPYPWQTTGFEPADGTSKRMTTFEGGQGLLCGTTWGEPLDRELAARKERDRIYAERQQSLQRMLRSVDQCFSRSAWLNEKLLKRATEKISPAANKTFVQFKMFCETWGLPFLPETAPQAITLFVLDHAANAKEAKRLVAHIAESYDKINPRPWRDPLVSVVLETLNEPAEKEEKELN